jgi:hypothetical protein
VGDVVERGLIEHTGAGESQKEEGRGGALEEVIEGREATAPELGFRACAASPEQIVSTQRRQPAAQ